MVTKTILARAKRLKSRVSATQKAHSPAPQTGVQNRTLATQPPLLSSSANVTVSPSVAPVTSRQKQARPASRTSQTSSQPQRTHSQTQSCVSVSISAPTTASTTSPQTRAQSCQSTSTTTPLHILPPISSTAVPQTLSQTQSSSSISASTPPQPPNASTPSLQTQFSWSTLASTPPRPPNPSTSGSQAQSHASNPGAATPQVSTPSLQAQPCPPTPASTQGLAPAAGTASPQEQSLSSAPLSASKGVARRNWKIFSGGCITVALAFAGVYLTGLYGKVTLKYTRWTLNNDFRDGCINDLDHNLTLAEECFAELAHPRVSAVNMKRQLGAVQDAHVDNALYWTVVICIPTLTCVLYLVWKRTFARDGPRPVVSLVKVDFSNCGQDEYPTMTQIDEDMYDLNHIREQKIYDNMQQAAIDAPPSDPGSDEDYFQAWRDRMKSPREDVQTGGSDTESTHSDPSRLLHVTRSDYASTEALWSGANSPIIPDSRRQNAFKTPVKDVHRQTDSRRQNVFETPVKDVHQEKETDSRRQNAFETLKDAQRQTLFEAEFKPSGNRVKCQQIELYGHISEFRPTDGILLEVWWPAAHRAETILQLPFEREATSLELMHLRASESWPLKFPKRATWARRLGLPNPRFVYILVKKEDTLLLGSLARRKAI
jgi:hypothetical protein